MCKHQAAAKRKAAAEAAALDAELKCETAEQICNDIPLTFACMLQKEQAGQQWVAAAYAAVDAAKAAEEARDACDAAHNSFIDALRAKVDEAQRKLEEARAQQQWAMERAASDAIARFYGYHT